MENHLGEGVSSAFTLYSTLAYPGHSNGLGMNGEGSVCWKLCLAYSREQWALSNFLLWEVSLSSDTEFVATKCRQAFWCHCCFLLGWLGRGAWMHLAAEAAAWVLESALGSLMGGGTPRRCAGELFSPSPVAGARQVCELVHLTYMTTDR